MSAPANRTPRRPYPGLRPFRRDESDLFFGRDDQVDQLLDKLAETRFLAVIGTSGSGKSSLVRAGLLPALDSGVLTRSIAAGPAPGTRWSIAELRPGEHPFRRLAAALQRSAGFQPAMPPAAADPIAPLEQALRRGPRALPWLLGLHPLPPGERLLILVDQFEELFRYRRADPADAAAFVALLLGATAHPDCFIVITLRPEYLGDCARFPGLPEAINAGLFLTPRLTPEQLADAVQLPARLPEFGGDLSPGLVHRLLAEASGEQDQLPLVQHLLMRLWDGTAPAPDGTRLLDEAGYEALGGLQRALNDHAEEALAELTQPGQQAIAEAMFRALTERTEGERDTRRPVPVREVADLTGSTPEQVIACAAPFRRADRSLLMPPPEQDLGPDDPLDITHEALIRQWRKLQAWIIDEAEKAEMYRRLESAARRWKEGKGALWIEPDLGIALDWVDQAHPTALWAARYGGDFDLAMSFLEDGRKAHDQDEFRRLMAGFAPPGVTSYSTTRSGNASASTARPGADPPASSVYRIEHETLNGRDYRDLSRDPEVRAMAPPIPIRLIRAVVQACDGPGPQDPEGSTWGLAAIGALSSPYTGRGIRVAVLDTGIDSGHEAFQDPGLKLVQQDFTGEGNGDRNGHGTYVAGTILGRPVDGRRIGVAPGVSLALIGKVIGQSASADTGTLLRAIQWATDAGAHIISLALGFDFPALVRRGTDDGMPVELAISRALKDYRDTLQLFDALATLIAAQVQAQSRTGRGPCALLITAAGDESRRDLRPEYRVAVSPPASADGFVSVGALDTAGPPHDRLSIAPFSNCHPQVCAPGVCVLSARAGGGLVRLSGTSMASSHVAGLAALWAERELGHSGAVRIATIGALLRGRAARERLEPGTDVADVGAGLVCAPQD
ncbi:S8 family serine peptidase [Candidatus Thiodictyon syntrophicum]|jgi:subtilisin family serine protease|uniref:Peptidase S8/S53 domain-containing protein n=1 Tax=Candidatus Thiodictyon syntrophicum TaxID=1166950 RepID=A0A2K8U3H0_9GAMM|nr:S8 family serine peptidase [Candidatus Thiodictyon syntrophicum]AUB80136.1 hypothetical protein THSYN_03605 [Candidatus Thiodictyon syntrophicum]